MGGMVGGQVKSVAGGSGDDAAEGGGMGVVEEIPQVEEIVAITAAVVRREDEEGVCVECVE